MQFPTLLMEVAPVLVSDVHGTGKSTISKIMGRIFGDHGESISDMNKLTGRFSVIAEETLFVGADEIMFSGDRKRADVLKGILADDRINVEKKFFDAQTIANMLGIIFTSNHEHVAHVEASDRRYGFLEVMDTLAGDKAYWAEFYAWLKGGGYGEILFQLLQRDVSQFERRDIPVSKKKAQNILASLEGVDAWLLESANRGTMTLEGASLSTPDANSCFVDKNNMYAAYLEWTHKHHRYTSPMDVAQFWKHLRTNLDVVVHENKGGKGNGHRRSVELVLPPKAIQRVHLANNLTQPEVEELDDVPELWDWLSKF
ncbi:DUF5906 domain-containing protein [uncultured Shimia sp.]|uniref:DUF5906 domain-containing protein n=1 Tax=uncultured Shimia sp. TaxID=573152 RepID=UPI00263918F7|nr:DUF5906 domain-containing protein [uncultured Shimia sp.]